MPVTPHSTRPARTAACALLLGALLLTAACGSDDEPQGAPASSGDGTPTTSGAATAPPTEAPSPDAGADLPDSFPCDALTVAQVGSVLGAAYEVAPDPSGGCDYSPVEVRTGPSVNVTLAEIGSDSGGFDSYAQTSASLVGATATPLPGIGTQAFVVAGTVASFDTTQAVAAAELTPTRLVSVTVTGGEAAAAGAAAQALLPIAAGAL